MKQGSTTTYARTVQDITGSTNTTFNGYTAQPYSGYSGPTVPEYKGYTQGPSYWGKTFFIWPPDPRTGNDWRTSSLTTRGRTRRVSTDNTMLWNSRASGRPRNREDTRSTIPRSWPGSSRQPEPVPSPVAGGPDPLLRLDPQSRSARRAYPPSDQNQRFWKEYIDYVIGVYGRHRPAIRIHHLRRYRLRERRLLGEPSIQAIKHEAARRVSGSIEGIDRLYELRR